MHGRQVLERVGGQAILLAAALSAVCGPASALINPGFTPVQLTEASTTILAFKAEAPTDAGELPVRLAGAVKGKVPVLPPRFLVPDPLLRGVLRKDVFTEAGNGAVDALLFEGAAGGAGGGNRESPAALNIDGIWFGLQRGPESGTWVIVTDTADRKAVWNGGADMLRRCVENILAHPGTTVPVRAGVAWSRSLLVGKVEGGCGDLVAVVIGNDKAPMLLAACEGGDRAYRFRAGTGGFEDVSASLPSGSRSQRLALADFNADGRADLACAAGRQVTVWAQTEAGAFATKLASCELDSDVTGIACVDAGRKGRAGLVVSTAAVPQWLEASADGRLSATPLGAALPPEAAAMGVAHACLAADWDGDSFPDVLQPFAEGGLLYRGRGDGRFEAPRVCGDVYSGAGAARGYTGDFDADGQLDVAFMGDEGLFLWRNRGAGRFEAVYRKGEPDYIARDRCSGGATGDLNGDGRQEFVVLYRDAAPHPFFGRGFFSFGYAAELDLVRNGVLPGSAGGQQGGLLADVDGDGAQDLVLVLRDGTIRALLRDTAKEPALCVKARLSADAGMCGPITVSARDAGDRELGAWSLLAGGDGAVFGLRAPGPVTVRWRYPGAGAAEHRTAVLDAPITLELGTDRAAEIP